MVSAIWGAAIDDFAFVGLCEHFDREPDRLAVILGNRPMRPERQVTADALALIREVHATDSYFYNDAAAHVQEWYEAQVLEA